MAIAVRQYNGFPLYWTRRQLLRFGVAGVVLPFAVSHLSSCQKQNLSIDSRRQTWDIIMSQYGPDIAFMDRALAQTFSRYAIDNRRMAIAGFSDGASYALSVGITNGDLFTHVIAFSPGFMAPADQIGSPRLFISHGKRDNVLPIERCSRRIVPSLQQAGYEVLYQEFDGPHTVPVALSRKALEWFTEASPT